MGIIKAVTGAIGGGLADQWLEVFEPDEMGDTTVFTRGVQVRKDSGRGVNKRGTEDFISDGSVIHVYDNQFMMLVDGGRVVDYSAEPGYFKVSNRAAPSMFNGPLPEALLETFSRIKFGGLPSAKQKVFYINLQEIKGIKFGTRSPINYFDAFYNSELFLRAHGNYSIRITDPLKFYQEAVPKSAARVDINDINEQYLSEFMAALRGAINQMSADGVRISHVTSKGRELSAYMSATLDEEWRQLRGLEVQAVGLASVSYDEESQKLINMRNQGAMLADPAIREGFVQGAMARGVEAAGSNRNGATAGFMGLGLGLQAGGAMAGAFSQSNQAQINSGAQQAAARWACGCGAKNSPEAKFCGRCGQPRVAETPGWACSCGQTNPSEAKFCLACGAAKPAALVCGQCGYKPQGPKPKFCPECGSPM